MKSIGIILDTNYFLHFKGPEFIPWNDLVGAGHVHLLISDPLSKELDRQKNSKTGKIKERAEKTIKNFFTWFNEGDEWTLNSDIKLVTLDLFQVEFEKHQLSKEDPDDWFLAYALELIRKDEYQEIYLVSNDFGVHNKAKKRKIKTIRLDDSYRLPDPVSESEKEINLLKAELLKFQNRQPSLKISFANTEGALHKKISKILPFSEEEKVLLLAKLKTDNPFAFKKVADKKNTPKNELINAINSEALEQLRKTIIGVASFFEPTPEQLANYDIALENYFEAMVKYEADKRDYLAREARSVRLKFEVRNQGTARATDIQVSMHIPVSKQCELQTAKKFESSYPKEPEKPSYPQNSFQSGFNMLRPEDLYIPKLYDHHSIAPAPNVSKPRITPTNSFDIDFEVADLLHTQSDFTNELVLTFPTVEEAHSFKISYSIICPEIVERAEGFLHVRID